jgi:membrane protein implicated in regulation of membrane protease activity
MVATTLMANARIAVHEFANWEFANWDVESVALALTTISVVAVWAGARRRRAVNVLLDGTKTLSKSPAQMVQRIKTVIRRVSDWNSSSRELRRGTVRTSAVIDSRITQTTRCFRDETMYLALPIDNDSV